MIGRTDQLRLVCVACGSQHSADERFCPSCRLPLSYLQAGADEVTERQRQARKVKPQFAEGALFRVAGARNQPEAEFIQGLLLEAGVPSLLRRSAGFDVPDFLAAGPRDILVPASGVVTARQVLLEADLLAPAAPTRSVAPGRLLAGLLLALALGAVVIWLITLALR